ncbi:MAG: glycosyltransferase [Chitinivibrionales bacterium]|nr:glycosyltransferase [Chitinivibrionales bacterium]
MLTVAFFNHGNLIQQECLRALHKLCGVRVVVIDIAAVTSNEQAGLVGTLLLQHACNVLFTINNWGLDREDVIGAFLERHNIVHVNWDVDDPFFLAVISNITFAPHARRFDFVSDRGYVEPLRSRGYTVRFLPLATDPDLFKPDDSLRPVRRCCFVGNSYRADIDKYIADSDSFLKKHLAFINSLLHAYARDMQYPLEAAIEEYLAGIQAPRSIPAARLAFNMKHFIGYLFRKNLVVSLAGRYEDFMVFGDRHWAQDLPQKKVSPAVGYYTNLAQTYQQTQVNIDINRIVIRDGFTQRVFDCLASGAFIITSPKKVVDEFFVTGGPQQELVVFRDGEDLQCLIDYYLDHEEQRQAIAARGRRKVLGRHTYDHRIREIFRVIFQ